MKAEYVGLLFILLFAILLKTFAVGAGFNEGILLQNTLDFSWQVDSIERFLHGYVAGRDFVFTYGPLYQFITSIPAIVFHLPSYIALIYAQYILLIIVCFLLFYVTRQVFSNKTDHALVLIAALFFLNIISTSDIVRVLLPFVYAFLYINYVAQQKLFSIRTGLILLLPAFFGLYTFDIFILCFLLTFCLILLQAWQNRVKKSFHIKHYFLIGVIHLLIICLFAVVISLLLTQNFNYLIYSFDTVRNYQYVMNIPWDFNRSIILFVFPLGLFVIFIYFTKQKKHYEKLYMPITVAVLTALLQLKAAFIRSDEGHILLGVYPSILVLFFLLYLLAKKRQLVIVAILLLYTLLPVKNTFYETLSVQNFKSAFSGLVSHKDFFDIYKLPETYYYSEKDVAQLSPYIKNNSHTTMVYPYDSFILNAYGNTFNSLPLQWYQYSNSIVEKDAVEKLTKSPPKYIILGIDTVSAVSLDAIPNFTRNSILAKWMLQNYSIEKATQKFLILRYTPQKKNTVAKKALCDIYEIDISHVIKNNPLESLGKPSTYYLNDTVTRLPYRPDTKEILIINNFDKLSIVKQLFERGLHFDNYRVEKKELTILTKNSLSFIPNTTKTSLPAKCY